MLSATQRFRLRRDVNAGATRTSSKERSLLANLCVSRAPPTRAVAPGLVPRLPALEEEQEHRRGRQTGTRRPEMLRAETDRAGELQRALGRAAQAGQEEA